MLRLRTLGRLDLTDPDGRSIRAVLAQPKRAAVLVYLATATPREFVRRAVIQSLFWPEADEARAAHSLSQSLYKLRLALGSEVAETRGDHELRLAAGILESDIDAFREALAGRRWADALALYQGDFLEGLELSDAGGFERWADTTRGSLRRAAADAAWALADEQLARGAATEGERTAERALELDPVNEPAVCRVMNGLAAAGRASAAVRFHETFRASLRNELEVEPSAEITALAEKLRRSLAHPARAPVPEVRVTPPAAPPAAVIAAPEASGPAVERGVADARGMTRRGGAAFGATRSPRLWAAVCLLLLGLIVVPIVLSKGTDDVSPPPSARRQITFTGSAHKPAISPDGHYVAFVRAAVDSQLLLQAVEGGAVDTIDLPGQAVRTIEWSPDGTHILMTGIGTAFIVPRLGGDVRIVPQAAAFPAEVLGNWLRDGNRISLRRPGEKRLLVIDLRTDDTVSVVVDGVYTHLLEGDWSPTADVFVGATVVSSDPLAFTILIADMKGRTEVVLRDSVTLTSPRWSPRGDAIYFLRGASDIWRLSIGRNGRPVGRATRLEGGIEARPDWNRREFSVSRDGKRATYERQVRHSNVFVVDVPTGGDAASPLQLTNETALLRSAVVSPNGIWVAYTKEVNGEAEIYKVPLAGGSPPAQVSFGARVWPDSRIAWSPDGSQIAFASGRSWSLLIWTIDVRTRKLTQFPGTGLSPPDAHVAWNPGKLIAFQPYPHNRIALLDPEKRGVRYIRDDSAIGHFSPAWAPDGQRLAFNTFRPAGGGGIAIYDIRDSSYNFLGTGGWAAGWSPDSRWIYVANEKWFTRVDSRAARRKGERFFTPPWRTAENVRCTTAGPTRPNTFVCVVLESLSDVFVIDNFDPLNR